jgi:hypothetical protein
MRSRMAVLLFVALLVAASYVAGQPGGYYPGIFGPPGTPPGTPPSPVAIPELALWQANMTTFGTARCNDSISPNVAIASSTNASPIVVTTAAPHGLTGTPTVVVLKHLVNTAANGAWFATVIDSTRVALQNSTGNGVGGATGIVVTDPGPALDPGAYYDGEKVYETIAAYTGNAFYYTCADNVHWMYLDGYLIPNDYQTQGFRLFTEGFRANWVRTGLAESKTAVVTLSQRSFAADGVPLEWTADCARQREVAYAILAYIDAERVGEAHRTRYDALMDQILGTGGHFDQVIGGTCTVSENPPVTIAGYQPFMSGIQMHALIHAHELRPDSRVPPAIKRMLDFLWTDAWNPNNDAPGEGAFCYVKSYNNQNNNCGTDASDLNLLIAPAFAWYYQYSGDTLYRDRGNDVFRNGVRYASLFNGKHFNQNYLWSFRYVEWYNVRGGV